MKNIHTASTIAKKTGVTVDTIRTYLSSGVMPQPDGHIAGKHIWHEETINNWIERRPRKGTIDEPFPEGTEEAKAYCQNLADLNYLVEKYGTSKQNIAKRVWIGTFLPPRG